MKNVLPCKVQQREPVPSSDLIEALMVRALALTSSAYWNTYQEGWGSMMTNEEEPDEKRYAPMQLGELLVTQQELESGDLLLQYHFGGLTVSTYFDSKRLFYMAELSRNLTRYEFVDWFETLAEYLQSFQPGRRQKSIGEPAVGGQAQ